MRSAKGKHEKIGKLIIQDYRQFGGRHCWTAALMKVLAYHGLHLSEEMLFGLSGGIGFIYWYMKKMPSPFIGTRYGKGTEPLLNACRRIGAEATLVETTSARKGHEELKKLLQEGEPTIAFVDMVYLPYLALPEIAHFGAHTIVIFGLDEEENKVYISDCCQKPVTVGVGDLKRARSSKFPPFPPRNRLLRIKCPSRIKNLEEGIRESIKESCKNMLEPPIRNIGLAGMQKWADVVLKWPLQFKGLDLFGCLFNTFVFIEVSGTGGSAFRTMYARFLREAGSILSEPILNEVAEIFNESGELWSKIAQTALPDSWPTLKRVRELMIEKERIFREQGPKALERMRKINAELNGYLIREKVATEFEGISRGDLTLLLADLRQKILECYKIEGKAIEMLSSIVR